MSHIPPEFEAFSKNASAFVEIAQQLDVPGVQPRLETPLRDRLNSLLNELSSLNYRLLQLADFKLTYRLFRALANIPVTEDTLLVKACALIAAIIKVGQKQSLPIGVLTRLLEWLMLSIRTNDRVALCEALDTIRFLLKANATVNMPRLSRSLQHELFKLVLRILGDLTPTKNTKDSDSTAQYDSCSPPEIKLSAALCLESLAAYLTLAEAEEDEQSVRLTVDLLDCAITTVYDLEGDQFDEPHYCTAANALLSAARQLLATIDKLSPTGAADVAGQRIGELLGAGKAYMMHGLPDVAIVRPPVRLFVSQQAISEPPMTDASHNRGGKMPKMRKVGKGKTATSNPSAKCDQRGGGRNSLANEEPINVAKTAMRIDLMTAASNITSESDFSESEAGGRQRKFLQKQAALRLSALLLIDAVAQYVSTKVMFGYWHAFFPDESIRPQSLALLNCALRDPNTRCRAAALHAALHFVNGSRTFLTQAENRSGSRPDAYTPFSVALGDMIVAMYAALGRSLATEGALPVLLQALKCLIVLIQQTSFARLRRGFLFESVTQVRRLMRHRDTSIQVAALVALQELIARGDKSAEIFDIIDANLEQENKSGALSNKSRAGVHDDEEIEMDERVESDSDEENPAQRTEANSSTSHKASMSWLLKAALENLGVQSQPTEGNSVPQPVRIESLQVISAMSRNFAIIRHHLDPIQVALTATMNDANIDVQVHAVKCIDVIGHFMNIFLVDDKPTVDDQKSCHNFWQIAIKQLLDKVSQTEIINAALQSNCCDALSNISAPIFERLPVYEQRFLVCALNGAVQSPDACIRGAAIRALGVYVMFPTLREDSHFVESTIEAIVTAVTDGNMDVRVKSSWALANVTNAVLLLQSAGPTEAIEPISDAQLKQLFETTLACRYNDKVRCNAVRALGNLLRLIRSTHLAHQYWQDMCHRAIGQLRDSVTGSGNMKVKWNACYALGNCMHNAVFFETPFVQAASNWRALVIPTLCKLIVDYPNFKVRINAAAALAVPAQRSWLGEHYAVAWPALLSALEQSDQISDYNEYQHRDNLVDQLCITLAHYICLANAEDLIVLAAPLQRFDAVPAKWARVINRILPERASVLLAATGHLQRFQDLGSALRADESAALQVLCKCFIPLVR